MLIITSFHLVVSSFLRSQKWSVFFCGYASALTHDALFHNCVLFQTNFTPFLKIFYYYRLQSKSHVYNHYRFITFFFFTELKNKSNHKNNLITKQRKSKTEYNENYKWDRPTHPLPTVVISVSRALPALVHIFPVHVTAHTLASEVRIIRLSLVRYCRKVGIPWIRFTLLLAANCSKTKTFRWSRAS